MIKGIISSVVIAIATCILVVMALILRKPVKQYSVFEIRSDR